MLLSDILEGREVERNAGYTPNHGVWWMEVVDHHKPRASNVRLVEVVHLKSTEVHPDGPADGFSLMCGPWAGRSSRFPIAKDKQIKWYGPVDTHVSPKEWMLSAAKKIEAELGAGRTPNRRWIAEVIQGEYPYQEGMGSQIGRGGELSIAE